MQVYGHFCFHLYVKIQKFHDLEFFKNPFLLISFSTRGPGSGHMLKMPNTFFVSGDQAIRLLGMVIRSNTETEEVLNLKILCIVFFFFFIKGSPTLE
jgi:hypothetical protein